MHGLYETYETFHLLFHLLINAVPDILLREIISIHLSHSRSLSLARWFARALAFPVSVPLLSTLSPYARPPRTVYCSQHFTLPLRVFFFFLFSFSWRCALLVASRCRWCRRRRRRCWCRRSICCSDSFPKERVNEAKSTRTAERQRGNGNATSERKLSRSSGSTSNH